MHLRLALRSLAKSPGFTAFAVVILALGIGANTAIFSVVNAVLLRPLAYQHPERIVTIRNAWKDGRTPPLMSAPDFHDYHDQSNVFSAMAYYNGDQVSIVVGHSGAYEHVAAVTPEFFRVFETSAQKGRLFTEKDAPGHPLFAVVSQSFWNRHFPGRSLKNGASLDFDSHALQIIGVMPDGFHFPDACDLWVPSWIWPEEPARSANNYQAIAKLKPGITLEQAQAQLTAIATRLQRQYPGSNKDKGVAVTSLRDQLVGHFRLTLYLLLGAVVLVLLIACANAANLSLARATSRAHEIAICAALGASRKRLAAQLIIESLLLSLMAGAAGLLLANWGVAALLALAPHDVPRLETVAIDGPVLAFTLALSVAASLIFGLAAAIQASGRDPQTVLRQGGARGVLGGAMGRLRSGLVVAEVALSVILMISAGLLIRSFAALNHVDLGFHADHLLVAAFDVPSADTRRAQQDFYAPLVQQLKRSPGVISAAAVLGLPTSAQSGSNGTYAIDGLELPNFTPNAPQAGFTAASPSYFATLGTRIVAGRDFEQRDTFEAPSVAIISQALAQKSFPHENPVGRKILCGWDRRTIQSMTIVGIAADMRNNGPAEVPSPEIYVPYQQHPHSNMDVVVRTSADPAAMTNTIQRIAHEINPEAPMRSTTMQEDLSQATDSQRFRSLLLGLFAGLAVCLAMAGIFAVTSYAVTQRTAEIGLRMALGADRQDILRMVFGQVFRLAIIGLFLGAAGAILSTRLIRTMLFSVTPSDPITYLAIVGSLGLITVLAGIIPAVRAARIEPLDALRQE